MALLASYLICHTRLEQMRNRLSALERELVMAGTREQTNEKKLVQIFDAVIELREATANQLSHLRARIDELLSEESAHGKRSAA